VSLKVSWFGESQWYANTDGACTDQGLTKFVCELRRKRQLIVEAGRNKATCGWRFYATLHDVHRDFPQLSEERKGIIKRLVTTMEAFSQTVHPSSPPRGGKDLQTSVLPWVQAQHIYQTKGPPPPNGIMKSDHVKALSQDGKSVNVSTNRVIATAFQYLYPAMGFVDRKG